MKNAIGWGLVTALLLTAGCGSDNNNGGTGSGGHADASTGDTGTGGTRGSGGIGAGGNVGQGAGGAAGSGLGGGAGAGAGGAGGNASGGAIVIDAGAGGAGGNGSGGAGVADAATGGAGGTGFSDGGTGGSDAGPPISIPSALAVPAGATLKIVDHGVGAQIYTCAASGGVDAGVDGGALTYAWVLKAPDAKLFDSANVQVGTHGMGPNWTSTVDGSVVNGVKVAQVESPLAAAIPWLLLRASSTSGTGVFSDITYVQRVNTTGGKAPATGCDALAVNTEVRIDYTADYYFYTGGAGADWLTPPANVPAILAVPAGATLKIHDHAIGAQIYTCTASGGADGGVDAGAMTYAWVLKAPDAILYDATFAQVGTHGAGPHWTSIDGSTVNGTKLQQASPSPGAIPWLLLKASSTSGNGVFTDITYVQRLNTAGGNAPASGCDATTVNTDTRVNYSADYYFFTGGVVSDAGSTG